MQSIAWWKKVTISSGKYTPHQYVFPVKTAKKAAFEIIL